jgi:hypothetical protein
MMLQCHLCWKLPAVFCTKSVIVEICVCTGLFCGQNEHNLLFLVISTDITFFSGPYS